MARRSAITLSITPHRIATYRKRRIAHLARSRARYDCTRAHNARWRNLLATRAPVAAGGHQNVIIGGIKRNDSNGIIVA